MRKSLIFHLDLLIWTGVIVQRDKKGTFSGVLQKLQNRVSEFAEQTKALTLWEALNNQLRSTDALCSKVAESEPAQKQVLSQLVTEVKEWFATESWDPLFRSSEFSERLGKVQSDRPRTPVQLHTNF